MTKAKTKVDEGTDRQEIIMQIIKSEENIRFWNERTSTVLIKVKANSNLHISGELSFWRKKRKKIQIENIRRSGLFLASAQ